MEKCKYSLDEIKKQITSTNYYDVLSFFSEKQIDYRLINEYVFEKGLDCCAKLFVYTKHGVACFYVIEEIEGKSIDLTQAHLIGEEDIPKLERLLQKEKEKIETLEFVLRKQRVRKTVGRER